MSTSLTEFLGQLHKNQHILLEREAKYGGVAPLYLLNQLDDYRHAIALTEQAIEEKLTLAELQGHLSGLIIEIAPYIINLPETPVPTMPQPAGEKEPIQPSPYRGLFAFRPEHAHLFFGREAFTAQLVRAVDSRRLVALLGASGSGKSSVVFAGLVPALDKRDPWLFTTFRPGSDPFVGLANALVPLIEPELSKVKQIGEARDLAGRLREGRTPLSDYLDHIQRSYPDHRLLLIADQFEELYTLCPDLPTRHAFLNALIASLGANGRPSQAAHLILTLRADFLGQASLYRPLADALQGTTELLGPMTRSEMTEAIEKPAALRGVIFEANLVERLLNDVGAEEGSLPLLEFALDELWQHQHNHTLTHVAYDEIGGVTGALSRHADKVYRSLSPAEQAQARRVFVQLVNPGAGTEDTRRLAVSGELPADWSLVAKLAGARLVVTNQLKDEAEPEEAQESVEVVHEALIRHWERLRVWMDEDRTFRAWQERLRFALRQWQEADYDADALLRGAPLAEAEGWLAERKTDLNQAECKFIEAGRAAREQEAFERKRRTQQIIVGLGVGLVVVAIAAIFGFAGQRQAREAAAESERQSQIALAQSLAALAPRTNNDTELTTLLAIEALHLNRQSRGQADWLIDDALRQVLFHHPYYNTTLSGPAARVLSVAFSPDGGRLASGGADGTVRLWQVSEPSAEPVVLSGPAASVLSVAFSPDGGRLASGSADGTVRLWQVSEPSAEPVVLSGPAARVWSVAFSPDGGRLASGSEDGTVRLWRIRLEELASMGCNKVRRNLSLAEWQRYLPPGTPYHRTCAKLPSGLGAPKDAPATKDP